MDSCNTVAVFSLVYLLPGTFYSPSFYLLGTPAHRWIGHWKLELRAALVVQIIGQYVFIAI